MGEKKVTTMVLEVNLQCWRCYKKVKKVLSKLPQIRDQVYDEKANTVTITVVCCSPEKIRDKICCKGGESINSIDIKKPEKPKPVPKPKPAPAPTPAPDPAQAPARPPAPPPPRSPAPAQPAGPTNPAPPPPLHYPSFAYRFTGCYHGHVGGPCYYGGPPPRPCYETYGRPVYDRWGSGGCDYKYYYSSRGECFSEENPQACSIM